MRSISYRSIGFELVEKDTEAMKVFLTPEVGRKLMEYYSNEEARLSNRVGFKPTPKMEERLPFDFCTISRNNRDVRNVKKFK